MRRKPNSAASSVSGCGIEADDDLEDMRFMLMPKRVTLKPPFFRFANWTGKRARE